MSSEKCRCPPPPMEIPKWFVTYSDVITLLMTFFILLLTFASSEPEELEKMQAASFGVVGSPGVVGSRPDAVDRNSPSVRYRPNIGRRTSRGSEVPPADIMPIGESAAKGLEALENSDEMASAERISTETLIAVLKDENGRMTPAAVQQFRMIAVQLRSLPLLAELQVSGPDDLDFTVGVARYLQDELQVPSGQLAVSVGIPASGGATMKVMLTRTKQN